MRKSFILYTEQREVINKLTDEQAGKLVKALYEYSSTGTMPELEPILDLVITPIKQSLDRDNEKWEDEKTKRSEAGRIGGIKRALKQGQSISNKSKQCLNVLSTAKQSQANQADNVNVNVNVNDNVNVNNNIYTSTDVDDDSFSPKTETMDEEVPENKSEPLQEKKIDPNEVFETLWDMYPRKEGKQDAYRHFKSWLKGKEYLGKKVTLNYHQMWEAVNKYRLECQGKEAKYIKQGSTFFNNAIAEYVEMMNSE